MCFPRSAPWSHWPRWPTPVTTIFHTVFFTVAERIVKDAGTYKPLHGSKTLAPCGRVG